MTQTTLVPDIISDKEGGYVREEIEIALKAFFKNEHPRLCKQYAEEGISWKAMSSAIQAYIDCFKDKSL